MSRLLRALFVIGSFTLVIAVVGGIYWNERLRDAAFERNDAQALPSDETGLRHAYELLREGGYRVALQTPEAVDPPGRELAWWIFQSGPDWFADPETRAQEIRRFVEKGGTVVFAPVEAVTVIPDGSDDVPDELTGRVDRFFSALGLDLRLLAFEPPAMEEDADLLEDDQAPPPDDAAATGYPLMVVGHGGHFESLNEVETSWGNYFEGESLLRSEIRLNSDGFPLVVEFPMGKGKLVLLAESTYFENEFLDRPANRALLEALAHEYGGGGIQLFAAR